MAHVGFSKPVWIHVEVIARDAFVESLVDPSLRIRVLERYPTMLEEALKIASRLEALGAGDLEKIGATSDGGRRSSLRLLPQTTMRNDRNWYQWSRS